MYTTQAQDSFTKFGVKHKSIALSTCIILGIVSVLSVYFISTQRNLLRSELQKRAISLTKNFAYNSEYPVLLEDISAIEQLTIGIMNEEDVKLVQLRDAEGNVLISQESGSIGPNELKLKSVPHEHTHGPVSFTEKDDFLFISARVWKPKDEDLSLIANSTIDPTEGPIGEVLVGFSLERTNRLIISSIKLTLMITLGIAVVWVLMALVIVEYFVQPLLTLAKGTNEIASGNLSHRVEISRRDEIGYLAYSFNDMAKRLEKSQNDLVAEIEERKQIQYDLQKARNGLELMVQERTEELVTANKKLKREVEDRKIAEEELRESEERYKLSLEATNDGIWDWDLTNDKVHTSDRFKELIGLKGDYFTLILDDWSLCIHPDYRERVMQALHDHLKGNAPFNVDYLYRYGNDEEYRWHNSRGMALFDEHGKAYRMVGATRDINERRQAEEALKRSMEYFRLHSDLASTLISLSPREFSKTIKHYLRRLSDLLGADQGILIHRPESEPGSHEIYSWNREGIKPYRVPANAEEFSYTAKTVRKGEIFSYSSADELPSEAEAEKEFFLGEGIKSAIIIPINVEGRFLGGLIFQCHRTEKTWPSDLVKQLQLIGQSFAYSLERKQAEKALRDREDELRAIFENVNDLIVYVDAQGTVIDVNKRIEDIFGYKPEEMVGKKFTQIEFCRPDILEECINRFARALSGNIKNFMELEAIRKDGDEILIEINSSAIRKDGKITNFVTAIRDITERKVLEERLQRAQKMEAIGTLAGGVAHDLNNVLSGIVSYPDLLLMKIPQDSPLRKPILTMKKSGEKAAAIVQDLLTLARRGVAVTQVVNLNNIISEYLKSPENQKLKLAYPDIHFETNLEKDLLNILGSPIHLSKTLMNLASNAAEAMVNGGRILISTENRYVERPIRGYENVEEGDYVALSVSDTGIGISSKDMERVFEPFYTKKGMGRSGTGLGMAVVWGTLRDHNGYIDVQSTEGKGTTFTLYFPVTRRESSKDRHPLSIEEYKGKGESILVVDDVEEQREIASGILKTLGYVVTSASSGEEAIEYLQNNSADLLVLDMIMAPGIDGLDTYKRILELHPGQKAIIASGFSETDRVKEAKRLGVGQYLKKPYALEQLGITVKIELDKR